MNPQDYPGSPEAPASGFPAAPPPPPPPPAPGQVPALRISTASELGPRRPAALNAGGQDPYEPPAAIQNAMMTKDKKPFTYTPGMGGKLDLSQIRSPRMARRVAKNANDEGIEGPPKSSLAQEPRSPGTPNPQMYSCPQVAVPVFPQGMPQQPAVNPRNSTLARSPPVIERVQSEQPAPRPLVKVETKIQPVANSPDTPTPPTSPTQVTLAKAPTPWMQKQAKQQEELPEWAKRSSLNRQDSSSSGQSDSPQQQPAQLPRQIVVVSSPRQPAQPQYQQQTRPVRQESERAVPVRIEDRPSVFAAMNEPGHHQLMNTTPHHQSRWGNPVGMSAAPPAVQQNQGGAYIVPIQVDGQQQYQNSLSSPTNANHNPMQYQPNRNVQRVQVQPVYNQQPEPGPVQSKSFKVLQKITDTDPDQIDGEQLRKLQLTEDDRFLMNKFKEQDEVPIPVQHIPASQQQVQEPKKYMGGAIPSRSFRILQAMTAPESIGPDVTDY
ncbi:ras-associated and pleckstrin homology domains-containing protein 1 isoform X2 [Nasonia vitripennis]|uniref:Uncharacterized protein n=1 Tax=Nasonia vitripennis TaxID=7425 RepID=A0A7M7QC59_NASVI|nr:ras-associated and pleckstrin homology domains-containing protein 1 isoform X2 [Nasonia vitripennis]